MLKKLIIFTFFTMSLAAQAEVNEAFDDAANNIVPDMDCVIEPSQVVDVGAGVPGLVKSIHTYRSDLVKKGAVIVELDSSVEQAAYELAKARAKLKTSIELRRESARFGSATEQRNQELFKKSAISLHDMEKSKTEARIAHLQVRQEQENKTIAELEYQRVQAILEKRTIRSTVNGSVVEMFKSVGEYVDDEPLLRIAQLDPLYVETIVPVDYLGRLTPGMEATVDTDLDGIGGYVATVERVDLVADAASGTYGVRLSLPNPDYKIPAGLRCQVSFLPLEEQHSERITLENGMPHSPIEPFALEPFAIEPVSTDGMDQPVATDS